MTFHANTVAAQMARLLPRTVKQVQEEQLVDHAHDLAACGNNRSDGVLVTVESRCIRAAMHLGPADGTYIHTTETYQGKRGGADGGRWSARTDEDRRGR